MRRQENDCVGCPQGCRNCGRDMWYWRTYCDICGDAIDDGSGEYIDGKDICDDCLDEMENNEDE